MQLCILNKMVMIDKQVKFWTYDAFISPIQMLYKFHLPPCLSFALRGGSLVSLEIKF